MEKGFSWWYWVIETGVDVWENEKQYETNALWKHFHSFATLPNFHEFFYNSMKICPECEKMNGKLIV